MRIQAFVFNWKGKAPQARRLEEAIRPWAEVAVVNSDDDLRDAEPHWVHLDDSAYFFAQWNKALELFDADLLFHVQADAEIPPAELERLFRRARDLFETYPLGVLEPNLDYCSPQYEAAHLPRIEGELRRVPSTDCTCWFVAGSVVRAFPRLDRSVNKYGWGVSTTVAALARRQGRWCARDYSFLVHHPRGRGYSSDAADAARLEYLRRLEPNLAHEVLSLYAEAKAVRRGPGSRPPFVAPYVWRLVRWMKRTIPTRSQRP